MKIFFTTCCLCFVLGAASAQQQAHIFVGKWKGSLQWVRPGKAPQQYTMRLNVFPLDSIGLYAWHIQYGDSSTDSRPYTLKVQDATRGKWLMDEHNGIVLQTHLLDSCLQSAFTVMGNTILSNFCIDNGKICVRFFTLQLQQKTETGMGTAESPKVDSYGIGGYQYGLLNKLE